MLVKPNMGLVVWDSINDYFSHVQLKSNFEALDTHDHTSGKGKQIPYGGLAEQSVGKENLREGAIPRLSNYFSVVEQSQGFAAASSPNGTWFGGKLGNTSDWSTPTFPPQNGFIYINPADFAISGYTTKFNLRVALTTNEVASKTSFFPGLYRIVPTGGSGTLNISSTLVTGSNSAIETPAAVTTYDSGTAGSVVTKVSSDFVVSTPGLYGIGITIGTMESKSAAWTVSVLRVHYV